MDARRERLLSGGVVVLATLVVLTPVLRPGYVLTYDMVFVPRQPLVGDLVGLGWTTPRAVPSDLVVALLSHVVSGQIVQKLVLLGIVAGAGCGAARLCPLPGLAPAATALAYVWTPYLASHLVLGQWAVLVGYAALPWVIRAALDLRVGEPGAAWRTAAAMTVGALGGAPGWLITVPAGALTVLSGRRGGRWPAAGVLVAGALLALPWAGPAVLRPDRPGVDPTAAAAFAAHADTRLGTLGSVVTGGGMWNAAAQADGHDKVLYAVGALVLVVAAAYGWTVLRTWPAAATVLVAGVVSLLIAVTSTVAPGRDAVAHLPGGGLIRDATRYLPPWLLVLALGFGATAETLRTRLRATSWGPAVTLVVALPAVILPALGWGVGAKLEPVHYPRDIADAVRLVDDDPRPGVVAVLPFTTYRAYPWNGDRPVLDVLPRWFTRPVVYASDLPLTLRGRAVDIAGDDPFAARVAARLTHAPPSTLGALGVRWVVVDAPRPAVDTRGLALRLSGADVAVYEVPGRRRGAGAAPGRAAAGTSNRRARGGGARTGLRGSRARCRRVPSGLLPGNLRKDPAAEKHRPPTGPWAEGMTGCVSHSPHWSASCSRSRPASASTPPRSPARRRQPRTSFSTPPRRRKNVDLLISAVRDDLRCAG